ncbi:MAG: inositol monophosphatase [Chloroflexi bacterium]|nr:inositol monophosphatase [Chloroflexota bacterium]
MAMDIFWEDNLLTYEHHHDVALRAARAAGQLIKDLWSGPLQIAEKGPRDLVTIADVRAQAAIKENIRQDFPDHAFLAEESDAELGAENHTSNFRWIVDPLDGTTNYTRHYPAVSVAIGLEVDGIPEVGVVYDPLLDNAFSGRRGIGAWLNGNPVHVRHTAELSQGILGTEWPREPELRAKNVALLEELMPQMFTMRSSGSAALSICYVACGWLDAYFHFSLQPWDVAAAAVIVEAAGGKVTNLEGEPWHIHGRSYLISNGHLHPQLATAVGYFLARHP